MEVTQNRPQHNKEPAEEAYNNAKPILDILGVDFEENTPECVEANDGSIQYNTGQNRVEIPQPEKTEETHIRDTIIGYTWAYLHRNLDKAGSEGTYPRDGSLPEASCRAVQDFLIHALEEDFPRIQDNRYNNRLEKHNINTQRYRRDFNYLGLTYLQRMEEIDAEGDADKYNSIGHTLQLYAEEKIDSEFRTQPSKIPQDTKST